MTQTQTQTQAPAPAGQSGSPVSGVTFRVTVVGTTPLPGVEVPMDWLPTPVQSAAAVEIDRSQAVDLSSFLGRRVNGVYINEVQNNPFQPDVNYRGYTASPLLGTPQGLSVYMDGVRLNQPFGEVVSWDLIPRIALAQVALMPGSNPLFGLNTLGGALSLQTKDGRSAPGTTIQAVGGASARRSVEVEHGGRNAADSVNWYLAGTLFAEDGWRDDSPSDVRQIFGKVGWRRDEQALTVSVAHANNSLTGNGLQDFQLLDTDYDSIYTKPDVTDNRSTLLNVDARRKVNDRFSLQANAYYRDLRTSTLNGDINEESLDQSVYQPGAAERAALAAAGYGNVPASGLDASNTPFPSLRCIANVLLNDEPAEKLQRPHQSQPHDAAQRRVLRAAFGTRHGGRPHASVHGRHGRGSEHDRVRTDDRAGLSQSGPERDGLERVRRRRSDRRRHRRRTVRYPREPRRDGHDVQPVRGRYPADRRSHPRDGLGPLQPHRPSPTAIDCSQAAGRVRSMAITPTAASIRPPASPSSWRYRRRSTPATAREAAPRPRSSSAAPIPRSRASCPMRWPAIRRSSRS